MANYATLKAAIQQVVKTNGNQEITGALLQQSLLAMINSLGGYYQFIDIADTSTNPGTPDQNVFYIAGPGTYPNFNNQTIDAGRLGVLKYNGSWSAKSVPVGKDYDTEIDELKRSKVSVSPGKNLYNPENIITGKYIGTNGAFSNNSAYGITAFIPVSPGQYNLSCYYGSAYQGIGTASACINLYDENKERVSTVTGASQQLTIPSGVAYIRASVILASSNVQIERGTTRTAYEAYNPIYGYLDSLKNEINSIESQILNLKSSALPIDLNKTHSYTANAIFYFWEDLYIKQGSKFVIEVSGTATWGQNGAWIISNIGTGFPGLANIPSGGGKFELVASADITKIGVRVYNLSNSGDVNLHLVVNNEIQSVLDKKLSVKYGKNLFNKDEITSGVYFNNANGSTGTNSSYGISGFIPVTPGDTLHISSNQSPAVSTSSTYLIFYDSEKNVVSGVQMGTYNFTVPSGAAFMRFSIYLAYNTEIQVEVGTTRTAYEPYSPIGGYAAIVQDNSISYRKLDNALKERIDNAGATIKFRRFYTNATLAVNDYVKTLSVELDKDSLLSAIINGTIQKIQVGVGKTTSGFTYMAHWLEIDTTNVKLYWYNNAENVLIDTYPHGLTFTGKTTVVVESKIVLTEKKTVLRIFDDLGNIFEQNLPAWGVGAAFVLNGNTSGSLQCQLSLMPRQITKKIWLFGDSYVSYISNIRWPYYFAQLGLLDFFANNQPGLSPTGGYEALENMLSLGFVPTYLVWLLGMNGPTTEEQVGGQYVINPQQKTVIDDVVTICEQYGIIPIFGTVPTVPTRQKTGFCNYVRNLGYRYIDFAEAVGADSAGNWNTGLLSSDGVHPSAAGAKVLASRVFVDFPELSIME